MEGRDETIQLLKEIRDTLKEMHTDMHQELREIKVRTNDMVGKLN